MFALNQESKLRANCCMTKRLLVKVNKLKTQRAAWCTREAGWAQDMSQGLGKVSCPWKYCPFLSKHWGKRGQCHMLLSLLLTDVSCRNKPNSLTFPHMNSLDSHTWLLSSVLLWGPEPVLSRFMQCYCGWYHRYSEEQMGSLQCQDWGAPD